jgi:hypothetical protein
LADEIEVHPVSSLTDAFDEATAQEMLKHAFGIQKVRDRLARGRVMPIGVSRRGETGKGERRTYLVVAYDYTANMAVEISLDEKGELLELSEERYQPPPVRSEIERAIELAGSDDRLASKVGSLVAMAIPFAGATDELANQRIMEVLFGCLADRLPRYRAWVDLGTETVIHAGESCECCDQRAEVQP